MTLLRRHLPPELVVFDVDGTLHDTFRWWAPIIRAGLSRAFPRIRLEVPRNPDGSVINHVLPEAELRAFDGIVGHFHVQKNKQDPGPAMQWDRLLRAARAAR